MTKKAIFLLLLLSLLLSCSNKFLLKEKYVYKDGSNRTLSLNFISDSFCVIKNIYIGGENEAKQIEYKCRYYVLAKEYLLLVNNGEMVDTTGKGFFYFPLTNYVDTPFVKRANNAVSVIPNYSGSNYKHLKVPYVGYDSLVRIKGAIAWIKKDRNNMVVGFYKFKADN